MSGWCDHIDPPVSTTTVDGHTYHECGTCGAWVELPADLIGDGMP